MRLLCCGGSLQGDCKCMLGSLSRERIRNKLSFLDVLAMVAGRYVSAVPNKSSSLCWRHDIARAGCSSPGWISVEPEVRPCIALCVGGESGGLQRCRAVHALRACLSAVRCSAKSCSCRTVIRVLDS